MICGRFEKSQLIGALIVGFQLIAVIVLIIFGVQLLVDDTSKVLSEPPKPLECGLKNIAAPNQTILANFDGYLRFSNERYSINTDDNNHNHTQDLSYLRLILKGVDLQPVISNFAEYDLTSFRNLTFEFECGLTIEYTIREMRSNKNSSEITSRNIIGAGVLVSALDTNRRNYVQYKCYINLKVPIGDARGSHWKCELTQIFNCTPSSATESDDLNLQLTVFRMELEMGDKNITQDHFSPFALTC